MSASKFHAAHVESEMKSSTLAHACAYMLTIGNERERRFGKRDVFAIFNVCNINVVQFSKIYIASI